MDKKFQFSDSVDLKEDGDIVSHSMESRIRGEYFYHYFRVHKGVFVKRERFYFKDGKLDETLGDFKRLEEFFTKNNVDYKEYIQIVFDNMKIMTPKTLLCVKAINIYARHKRQKDREKILEKIHNSYLTCATHSGPTIEKYIDKDTSPVPYIYTRYQQGAFSVYFLALLPGIDTIWKKNHLQFFNEIFVSDYDFMNIKKEALDIIFEKYNIVPKTAQELFKLLGGE